MEDFIVFITLNPEGGYLACTPLIPDETIWGSTPEAAFENMKVRAAEWIGPKGFKFAQMTFRAEFSQQKAEEARAAHDRGETQGIEEAFAEIAGMETADWRKKVAAHEQPSKP